MRQGSRLNNILSLSNYDVFEMSPELHKKRPREWTKAEALAHFKWFAAIKQGRIRQMGVSPAKWS